MFVPEPTSQLQKLIRSVAVGTCIVTAGLICLPIPAGPSVLALNSLILNSLPKEKGEKVSGSSITVFWFNDYVLFHSSGLYPKATFPL